MTDDRDSPPPDTPADSPDAPRDDQRAADAPSAPQAGDAPPPAESAPGGRRSGRSRGRTVFAAGGWVRRLARLWGFLGFVVLVVVLARQVILPFIFALLLAYILAPIIDGMSTRADGRRRMPRGLAILVCYVVLLAVIGSFVMVLLPRLSKDAARIGREAPKLYDKLNNEWAPDTARWLERRFPSLARSQPDPEQPPVVPDVPLPPNTAFVLTPLPDGRYAVQLEPAGVDLRPSGDGGYAVLPREQGVDQPGVEDKIRGWVGRAIAGLQTQLGDFFRFGQALVGAVIRSVFAFFLVLMVTAFILIDLDKLREFARSLVPAPYRDDYDIIVAGVNRGLAGVIRGQLLICVINGVLTYIGLAILDVKYTLILAMVACIMSLIPIFGSILSTVPIVLAALVSGDVGLDITRAVLSVAWIVGIHFLEANFLNPKIIGSAAKIHPVLVIFALILGEHSYGLVGALLAVPVLSMVQVLFLYFRTKAWRAEDTARGASRPA